MKLPKLDFSRSKTFIHAFQAFVIFLSWALTIAVFTRPGGTDGRTAYFFALCWFSIPGLIYLAAVPLWPRTRRFGNPYAFAVVDMLFALLWFVAWIAVATYVGMGKSATPDDEDKEGKGGCQGFAYGSPAKCKLSTGTVVLGVFTFLSFVGTSYMSVRSVLEYRRTGMMPYDGSDPTFAAQSKAAFSSNVAQDFDEEEGDHRDPHDFRTGRYADDRLPNQDDDDYALLQQNELDDTSHPGGTRPTQAYDPTTHGRQDRPVLPMPDVPNPDALMHDYDTSYGGPYGHRSHSSNDYGYGR